MISDTIMETMASCDIRPNVEKTLLPTHIVRVMQYEKKPWAKNKQDTSG